METLPGETPIDDLSGLKPKWVRTRRELNQVEGMNVAKATAKYLTGPLTRRKAPFHLSWARRLHQEMFGDVWKWAGTFRTSDLNLGVPWSQVEVKLQSLLDDLPCWGKSGATFLEQVAMLHHRAVGIHPFLNGNGRWSRMLANIWLKLHGQALTKWPEDAIGTVGKDRQDYLAALKLADEGDYGPLAEQHRQLSEIPLDWL